MSLPALQSEYLRRPIKIKFIHNINMGSEREFTSQSPRYVSNFQTIRLFPLLERDATIENESGRTNREAKFSRLCRCANGQPNRIVNLFRSLQLTEAVEKVGFGGFLDVRC